MKISMGYKLRPSLQLLLPIDFFLLISLIFKIEMIKVIDVVGLPSWAAI
jgi:hypothetical protein